MQICQLSPDMTECVKQHELKIDFPILEIKDVFHQATGSNAENDLRYTETAIIRFIFLNCTPENVYYVESMHDMQTVMLKIGMDGVSWNLAGQLMML